MKGDIPIEPEACAAVSTQLSAVFRLSGPVCPDLRLFLHPPGCGRAGRDFGPGRLQPTAHQPLPAGDRPLSGERHRHGGYRHERYHGQLPPAHDHLPPGERRHHLDQRPLSPTHRRAGAPVRCQAVRPHPRLRLPVAQGGQNRVPHRGGVWQPPVFGLWPSGAHRGPQRRFSGHHLLGGCDRVFSDPGAVSGHPSRGRRAAAGQL